MIKKIEKAGTHFDKVSSSLFIYIMGCGGIEPSTHGLRIHFVNIQYIEKLNNQTK